MARRPRQFKTLWSRPEIPAADVSGPPLLRRAVPVSARRTWGFMETTLVCLIAYGEAWYAWYMRRLAERPANVLFALRQVFG